MADRTPAMMAALNVAMKARGGGVLLPEAVTEMVSRAQDHLPPGDPLRSGVTMFASSWQQYRRDPDALAELGSELHRAIGRATRPDPIHPERRDIHG